MSFEMSRRHLLAAASAFAAAAAINPFPRILPMSEAAAQSADATPAPEPADSQVIRWVDGGVPRLSIPAYASGLWIENLPNCYMTPFVQDNSGKISAGICSDYTVSDDQLTYTFTMNPQAVWSDGSKVTAHDIKYTWEWMANPTASGNIFNYYQTQTVAGNPDVYSGKATEMSGLVAVDDDTLQITLSQPYTPFIYYCTHCLLGAHQKANIVNGGPDWDKKPTVASGPFMVESFDLNSGALVLVQNPKWWGKKPTIQRVETNPVSDASTQLLTWNNDECEVWGSATTSDFYRQFGNSEIVEYPGPSNGFILFNTKQAPLDDLHFRRALQRATDIQTIVSVIFGDYATAATGISGPDDPAYVERPFLYDVAAAKAEIALSKYATGSIPPIVAVMSGNDSIKMGAVMQQMWQDALGIQLQVVPADQSSALQTSDAGIKLGGNSVLYLGPGGLLSWGWHKDNYWFNGAINTVDEDVEALLVKGDELPDAQLAERVKAYAAAEQLILDRGYVIPLFTRHYSIAVKKRVVNASLNPTVTFDLVNTYIAKQ